MVIKKKEKCYAVSISEQARMFIAMGLFKIRGLIHKIFYL
jgi:hypothetical protein